MRRAGDITALVISSPGDAWLLPDEPFLKAGCRVIRAATQEQVAGQCDRQAPRLVVLPLFVDGESSLPFLKRCMQRRPAPVVVLVAANDQINAAAEAMREGAFDCLFKPFSPARLAKTVAAALKAIPPLPQSQPAALTEPAPPTMPPGTTGMVAEPAEVVATTFDGLIINSSDMRTVLAKIATVAPSPSPVFVSGEVGTGKNLVARLIHDRSARADGPFVRIDCAALDPDKANSEIFGPGGSAVAAEGGTLFLDEICELDPELQPRLLQLIEARSDLGPGSDPHFRLITTTRHDPRAAILDGRLRADLFYRLHVSPIELPPLRGRPDDITMIARVKLREYAEAEGRHFTGFSDAALARLTVYDWPGNVRELLNVVWSVVLMHPGPLVTPDVLPQDLDTKRGALPDGVARDGVARDGAAVPVDRAMSFDHLLGRPLAEIEREIIEATIRAEGGSVPRAARVLDVSPSTIYRKREAWNRDEL